MFERKTLGQVPIRMGLIRGGGGLPPGTWAEGWDSFLFQPVPMIKIIPIERPKRILPPFTTFPYFPRPF